MSQTITSFSIFAKREKALPYFYLGELVLAEHLSQTDVSTGFFAPQTLHVILLTILGSFVVKQTCRIEVWFPSRAYYYLQNLYFKRRRSYV